ncbi:MAG: hypothetical protein ISN29_08895 [Gammaproteobacteria bacterium AqS3]|nr:hypothetical protein [Gammaproteobacteria bacterium AqS3]
MSDCRFSLNLDIGWWGVVLTLCLIAILFKKTRKKFMQVVADYATAKNDPFKQEERLTQLMEIDREQAARVTNDFHNMTEHLKNIRKMMDSEPDVAKKFLDYAIEKAETHSTEQGIHQRVNDKMRDR